MTEKECLFCRLVNGEIPSNMIYEDDKICCFLDIEPINEGHVLIIPKKHYLDADELDQDTGMRIMKLSMLMVKVLKRVYRPDGYSIMQNGGEFNDIGHYHMHVFPRYQNDGFGWTFGEFDSNERAEEVKKTLVSELEKDKN